MEELQDTNAVEAMETTDGTEASAFETGLLDEGEGHQLDNTAQEQPEANAVDGGGHQPGETTAEEPVTEAAGSNGAAPDGEAGGQAATVPITFLGRTAQVDAAAVQALAQSLGVSAQDAIQTLQKGMNYDHKNARELGLLRDYASAAGMSLEQYVNHLEQQKTDAQIRAEMQRIAAELPEGTPEEALRRIAQANMEKQRSERERQAQQMQQQASEQAKEQRLTGWNTLFAEHPELRENAPEELFQIIGRQKCAPAEAYYRLEAQQQRAAAEGLRNELAQAQQQLAAAQQNGQNRQTAVGSMSTAGETAGDAFLAGLDSGGY